MLSTFRMSELADFVLLIYKKQQDELLWEIWLNKDTELSFSEFKSKSMPRVKRKAKKAVDEQEVMKLAEQYFTPRQKGGDKLNE